MNEVRELDSSFYPRINELVSKAFGYQPPNSFFDDFPIWNTKIANHLGYIEEGELMSHAGIRFAEMKTASGRVPIALIGAVATQAEYRGHGMSTALMRAAIDRCEQKGAHWAFLWGSEHEFYRKFGFELSGIQGRASIRNLSQVTAQSSPQVLKGLTETIFHHLSTLPNGIALNMADRAWFFAHKNVKWYYLEKPFAFVAFERGMDLPHLVHEWGGDSQGLKIILSHVLANDEEASLLGRTADLRQLGFEPEFIIEESLCLAKPIQPNLKWNPEFWISGLSAC